MTPTKPRSAGRWRAIVCLATVLAFFPVCHHEFGGWDDEQNISRNAWLNPPTWRGAMRYWRAPAADLYVPLTWTAWLAIARLAYIPTADPAGIHLNPTVFHSANLFFHLLAALCALELLRRITKNDFAAAAGALLFALHPVQVEAVAWINGTKDVLAGLFALAALALYLDGRRGRFIFATALLVLAMLSKPSAIVVPAIALVFRRDRRLIGWFVIAIIFAIVAHRAQPASQIGSVPRLHRPLIAFDAIAFYVGKIFWPVHLAADYGHTPIRVLESATIYWQWLITVALAVVAILLRKKNAIACGAILIFVIAIAPVLGLVPFDFQAYSTVADHYLYFAMISPAILFALLVRAKKWLAIILIPLALLTFRQSQTWHDAMSIARQTVAVNPDSFAWSDRLAAMLLAQNQPEEALRFAMRAVESQPTYEPALVTLGIAQAMLGDNRAAAESFRAALRLNPNDDRARRGLDGATKSISRSPLEFSPPRP